MCEMAGKILNSQLPVSLISLRENMYEKITKMLLFLFKYCEEQEHNMQEISNVNIRLLKENEDSGDMQSNYLRRKLVYI